MKKLLALFLALCLLCSLSTAALAAQDLPLTAAMTGAQSYLLSAMPQATTGGASDTVVFVLARSGAALPSGYALHYAQSVAADLLCAGGVLARQLGGELGRAILALTAMGIDPTALCGQDLLLALADYDCGAGSLSTAITALRALDSHDYEIPETDAVTTQATRELYLSSILNQQLPDGGWAHSGGHASAELTASVLQVLAPYRSQTAVANAIDLALARLSALQEADGGFTTWSVPSAEPTAQVLLALDALGLDFEDPRFVKNGHTVLEKLLTYQDVSGGFCSTDKPHVTATCLALSALSAVQRRQSGQSSFYDLRDVVFSEPPQPVSGVQPRTLRSAPVTGFSDTLLHENESAITLLSAYGIVGGVGGGRFSPDSTMTRAQFARIVVSALGLEPVSRGTFADVPANAWYAPYVDTAAAYGIVRGVGGGNFNPESTITRQDAAIMLARTAALCGFDTTVSDTSAVSSSVSVWAKSAVAFCTAHQLMPEMLWQDAARPILRCELAQALCNLLMQTTLLQ